MGAYSINITEKRLRQMVAEEIEKIVESASAPAMPAKRSNQELGKRALEFGMGWGTGSTRRHATTRWFASESPPGIESEEEAKDWFADNVSWYSRYWGDIGYDDETGTWITTREFDTTG